MLKIALFDNKYQYSQMLLDKKAISYSNCEQIYVSFLIKTYVSHISSGKVIGLSKLNRYIRFYVKKLKLHICLLNKVANKLKIVLEKETIKVRLNVKHLFIPSISIRDETKHLMSF